VKAHFVMIANRNMRPPQMQPCVVIPLFSGWLVINRASVGNRMNHYTMFRPVALGFR
jgi:hypothetical protein